MAFLIPADPLHWPALNPILVLQRQNGFFSPGPTGEPVMASVVFAPTNATILSHLFLRNHTDMGVGLLGFSAYLSIGLTTYALARRYAWPATALTVVLIILSMPRFVFAATRPSIEMLSSATAVFGLLVIYRVIERPNIRDLMFLLLTLLFMLSHNALSPVLPLIFVGMAAIALFRRHGSALWWQLIKENRWVVAAMLPPMLVLSQTAIIAYNLVQYDCWTDPLLLEALVFNPDGLQGFGANLLRYIFENVHLTNLLDRLCRWMLGFEISHLLQQVYDRAILPLVGMNGAAEPFVIRWIPNEELSWFGPFGCLLSLPAVGYSFFRAPRRLKTIVVAMLAYFFVIALIVAWKPGNGGFLSLFFVCTGVCMAFFLSPWRIARRGRRMLQLTAAALLLYACVFDQMKPAFDIHATPTLMTVESDSATRVISNGMPHSAVGHPPTVWSQNHWTGNPQLMAARFFGDNRVGEILARIPADANLCLIFKNRTGIYPFLLRLPQPMPITLLHNPASSQVPLPGQHHSHLLYIDISPEMADNRKNHQILWQPDPGAALPEGALLSLN
jgi:hypothetical protein